MEKRDRQDNPGSELAQDNEAEGQCGERSASGEREGRN